MFAKYRIPILLLAIALVVMLAGFAAFNVTAREINRDQIALAPVDYVQSNQCILCHPGQYETWHQTYHRTMTQIPSEESVLGNFDDATLTFQGVTSRFYQRGEFFYIQTINSDGVPTEFEVAFTIGSRRIQQYVTRLSNNTHWRLPLAWNISEERWFHLNGGFLHPDGSEFNEHLALWDANCIFCHNTKAQPNLDWTTQAFDAEVEEFGIACESCHGPAEEHVKINTNPIRRYMLYFSDEMTRDPTLISPAELEPLRQVQVCGHCHGQRLPNPDWKIRTIMADGDPYTVGEDLGEHYTPMDIDSRLPDIDITLRFWQDGTPRLTAYEYQGWLMSDHQETGLTCTSCHNMHGGDPEGMIDEPMRGNLGCTQCHEEIEADVEAHTKHSAESTGSQCYACHMPKTTYGVLEIHPSHRITNPEPSRAWEYAMPEACTLCHTNQTALWAAEQVEQQFGIPFEQIELGDAFDSAENVRTLLAGDVVQRAVAAMAFSEVGSYSPDPQARLWAVPFLILTMERDNYPAIRHFAYRSLLGISADAGLDTSVIPYFDHMTETEARQPVVDAWWRWWELLDKSQLSHPGTAVPLDENFVLQIDIVEALLADRDDTIIAIGE